MKYCYMAFDGIYQGLMRNNSHEWNWRGKAEIIHCWPSTADSDISTVRSPAAKQLTLSLGKHFLENYNLWLHYFIVKVAAQGFSLFSLSTRTLSWMLLYCSVLSRATHFPCAVCSKNGIFPIWKRGSRVKTKQIVPFWSPSTEICKGSQSLSQPGLQCLRDFQPFSCLCLWPILLYSTHHASR